MKNSVVILIFILVNFNSLHSKEINAIRKDTLFTLEGNVKDIENNSSLSGVTVRVADTDKGTFTKSKGEFKLRLAPGLHTLVFSMVGRKSEIIEINLLKDTLGIEIVLDISSALSEGVVVIAEDPGMRIMRQVIEKKEIQRKAVQNYSYSLYTKFVASTDTLTAGRKEDDTDTTIVSIFESFSNGYFESPDNYYNEIIQRKQSANIPPQANFVTFGTNVNAFDDFIRILSNDIATPFHKDAPDFYDFILDLKFRHPINSSIARIIVTPNSSRKLFTGIVFIDTLSLSPVSVELYPNESVQLPFNAVLNYYQTFTLTKDNYIVPENLRIMALIDADIFWVISPRIDLKIENYANNYKFNYELPEGIFSKRRVEATDKADEYDSLFWKNNLKVALTDKEIAAYTAIRRAAENPDSALSTTIVDEILGPVNKFLTMLARKPFTGFEDIFRYNRVQGAYLGLGVMFDIGDYYSVIARTGYGLADKFRNFSLLINQYFDKNRQYSLSAELYSDLERTDNSNLIRQQALSLISLFTKNDYGDYFYNEGFEFGFESSYGQLRFLRRDVFIRPTRFRLFFRHEEHRGAAKNTDFALLSWNRNFRDNPPIIDGMLNSFGFELNWNYHPTRRFADFGFQVGAEYSMPELIHSDYDFKRYYGGALLRTATLPLWRLDLRFNWGFSLGSIPPQRFFSLESSVSGISAQSAFRGMKVKEFYGDRFWSLSFEHNFGEIIPGVLRITNIAELGLEFLTYMNIGWSEFSPNTRFSEIEGKLFIPATTASTDDKYYYEVGLGINKLLIFFRFDITARLSQQETPRFFITFSGASF